MGTGMELFFHAVSWSLADMRTEAVVQFALGQGLLAC